MSMVVVEAEVVDVEEVVDFEVVEVVESDVETLVENAVVEGRVVIVTMLVGAVTGETLVVSTVEVPGTVVVVVDNVVT